MKKNLLLSFVILVFSLISFLLFSLETYLLADSLNAFCFLLIAFIFVLVFASLLNLIIAKMFANKDIIKELSKSFLIIMVAMLIFNILELTFVKNTNFLENSLPYFVISILQSLRLVCAFSIPLFILVVILNFVNRIIFRGKKNESVGS